MIARLRERSPRGRIARQGLLALFVLVLLVVSLWIAILWFVERSGSDYAALLALPVLLVSALAAWVPLGRPRCPGCGYRFTRSLQYAAMLRAKPRHRLRHCPHCGVDLGPDGDGA